MAAGFVPVAPEEIAVITLLQLQKIIPYAGPRAGVFLGAPSMGALLRVEVPP